ncbi:hypothetical protein AZH53_01675 [Methanomicrobiaceae archaeon CYW5]|uniref:HVO_0476 family zinc finger protein n=1 Tax=Methanovulcanius yangii TaxID=1789227 RepID=UPI0029C9C298|nr:HVO_0476 family zinc finger protein [Methanovulcanius yangii]MBT8507140.1 hypothetical protein [Methanovulcanius yangii]
MKTYCRCPSCGEENDHAILKEAGDLLVQCVDCGNIFHIRKPKEPEVLVIRTVVSDAEISEVGNVELLEDEICGKGDLLVAEIGDEVFTVEVTGIECGDKRRNRAKAYEISTLWTRLVDEVVVKVSVHDKRRTIPYYIRCEGERDFVIGEIERIEKIPFRITHIKLRDGAMMRKEGWKAYARKITRVYGTRV